MSRLMKRTSSNLDDDYRKIKLVPIGISESVNTLTSPELFSYFGSNEELAKENQANIEFYKQFRKKPTLLNELGEEYLDDDLINKRKFFQEKFIKDDNNVKFYSLFLIKFIIKLVILSMMGNFFYLISKNVKMMDESFINVNGINEGNKNINLTYKPFLIISKFFKKIPFIEKHLPNYILSSFEGILLGINQPIFDLIFPNSFSISIFKLINKETKSDYEKENANDSKNYVSISSILRTSTAFLGISFALRKLDWKSFEENNNLFILFNLFIWLLLDSTISGFISSTLLSVLTTIFVFIFDSDLHESILKQEYNQYSIALWIGSFFFCGLILFGKVGRFLFIHYY
ncbi:INSIG family protein ASCRUDRAFT_69597 [Ascoidea rubescens DSM 1968]|uniref:Uncharacterized protein n=1 Tax=Ascoidea rubescens DSM 1968 TaxID=1344418 RepID=A0A1D2VJT5_9ASCO|nr:hypothetical protein ASCRUDRAFT_69597 [Ascoidea rubescens DSM 1968]ODV61872.1 hypothetical protein ASCRUDRAFT_69597 [Ascoidea rubescens DSM 1968]